MKKNILITGSTDGIGKLAAIKLAKEGHSILIHGRNHNKLQGVIEEVKQESNNNFVEGFTADFSDLSAVKAMAEEVKKKFSNLDVLINNAGVFKTSNPITKDKLDIRFVVNYLAPYLLTNEVLPLLKNSPATRIINLSSTAQSPVDFYALSGDEELSAQAAYAQSKLALTMWSSHLAKSEKGITTIAVNPGSLLNTKMANEAYGQFWSSADKGRDILCALATADAYQASSGKYFDNDKGNPKGAFADAHGDVYNLQKIDELIKVTNKILKNYIIAKNRNNDTK